MILVHMGSDPLYLKAYKNPDELLGILFHKDD